MTKKIVKAIREEIYSMSSSWFETDLYYEGAKKISVSDLDTGSKIEGLFWKPKKNKPVVIFHGGSNFSGKEYRNAINKLANICAEKGYGFLVHDYPAEPTEERIYDNNKMFEDWLIRNHNVKPSQFIELGYSLGTASATEAALRNPEIKKVILISPFTNMPNVVSDTIKNFASKNSFKKLYYKIQAKIAKKFTKDILDNSAKLLSLKARGSNVSLLCAEGEQFEHYTDILANQLNIQIKKHSIEGVSPEDMHLKMIGDMYGNSPVFDSISEVLDDFDNNIARSSIDRQNQMGDIESTPASPGVVNTYRPVLSSVIGACAGVAESFDAFNFVSTGADLLDSQITTGNLVDGLIVGGLAFAVSAVTSRLYFPRTELEDVSVNGLDISEKIIRSVIFVIIIWSAVDL